MTVLLTYPGRMLLRRWTAKESSIACGRVVQFSRVAAIHTTRRPFFPSTFLSFNDSPSQSTRRSFATKPGRPKGHTGKTTASKRTRTSKTSKASTDSPTKPKSTPKSAKKPKPKPKPKKRSLSEGGKLRLEKRKQAAKVKDLKATALSRPKRLPDNAWTVFASERMKASGNKIDKAMSEDFKNITLEQREHYNHLANQNKAANDEAYTNWINSFTPEQINIANNARRQLRKKTKSSYTPLKDDRTVKQARSSYIFFVQERIASGDYKNMKVSEIGSLLGAEWKRLPESDKKKYKEQHERDVQRYTVEYRTVYGKDPPSKKT